MNKYILLSLILSSIITPTAWAGTYEWTSGWGMGVSEYLVDDGNGNELVIACPDDDSEYVSASATVNGRNYSSKSEQGFDVVVDGKVFTNPFFTECRACGTNFPEFWEALRNANNLYLQTEGMTVRLPTRNIKRELPSLDDEGNTCRSAW
ncbi:hypothetical protein [Pseudomonas indica]|uniref:hypothetical protein n=1 Tax=Pseudomonas indica TaxID=137658 RepID=UPI000BAB3035|nr:hypothetical protein [Pseudomonas indica]PAU63661.1 hypothetical protein BZL42_04020 [Pseudomonas indica]